MRYTYVVNIPDRRYADRRVPSVFENDRDKCCIPGDLQGSQFCTRYSWWNLAIRKENYYPTEWCLSNSDCAVLDGWFIDRSHWIEQTAEFVAVFSAMSTSAEENSEIKDLFFSLQYRSLRYLAIGGSLRAFRTHFRKMVLLDKTRSILIYPSSRNPLQL